MRQLLIIVLLAGCTPTELTDCPDDPPVLTLTQGQDTARPLVDDQPMTIVFGPQGGWHLEFGARIDDPSPDYVLEVQVAALDQVVAADRYQGRLRRREGCTTEYTGFWAFLEEGPFAEEGARPPDLLDGEALELTVVLTTDAGVAEQGVVVVGQRDPREQ